MNCHRSNKGEPIIKIIRDLDSALMGCDDFLYYGTPQACSLFLCSEKGQEGASFLLRRNSGAVVSTLSMFQAHIVKCIEFNILATSINFSVFSITYWIAVKELKRQATIGICIDHLPNFMSPKMPLDSCCDRR